MKGISIRRQQKRKFFKKALRIEKSKFGSDEMSKEEQEQFAHRIEDNRAKCSCQMCRNPRHSNFYKGDGKLTMQEILEKEKLEDGNLDQD
ncbi:MAG: hypothetical protein M0R48_11030 [Candidatus Omnitrophica bacterium]|nr:hypothetical protein [Candidatus Omnitrophota bacterium]